MSDQRKFFAAATAGVVAAAALATGASAHHSYVMFDRTKTVTIVGTVRAWEMTSPHSYLWVVVPKKEGAADVWGMEGAGVGQLQRAGIHKSEVKPGDKVSVNLHPLRDGRTGGQLINLTLGDTGRKVNFGGGGGEPGKPEASE